MAIDFTVPEETRSVAEGICRFVEREVIPLSKELEDPRTVFDAKGHYTAKVLEIKRRVRTRSAEQGYYAMFVPQEIGGGG